MSTTINGSDSFTQTTRNHTYSDTLDDYIHIFMWSCLLWQRGLVGRPRLRGLGRSEVVSEICAGDSQPGGRAAHRARRKCRKNQLSPLVKRFGNRTYAG